MRQASLIFLEALIEAASPSGYENTVAALYTDYVSEYAADVKTDVNGNVIAILNPAAKVKIMLAGHMDEIGFIIHYIDDSGLLFFSTVGGHDSVIPVGQRVWVHGRERLAGVIGRKAIHLLEPAELKKKPEFKDLWIDIGASSRERAEAVVGVGDVATHGNAGPIPDRRQSSSSKPRRRGDRPAGGTAALYAHAVRGVEPHRRGELCSPDGGLLPKDRARDELHSGPLGTPLIREGARVIAGAVCWSTQPGQYVLTESIDERFLTAADLVKVYFREPDFYKFGQPLLMPS